MNMLKWLNNKKKDNKGFSLVELIIVVAIMAILVGLLAPQYIKYVEKSRKSADATNMDTVVNAVQVQAADGESDIPAADYTITINADGINAGDLGQYIEKNVADYNNIKLKSNKWDKKEIIAHISIDKDGNTTVSYEHEDFAKFIQKNVKASN